MVRDPGYYVIIDNTKDLSNAEMTPRLICYFNDRNLSVKVISQDDELNDLKSDTILGIVLSGGPILLSERSEIFRYSKNFRVLLEYTSVPILGICFGFQLMGVAYGGRIQPLGDQKRDRVFEEVHQTESSEMNPRVLFRNLDSSVQVYQCHQDYLDTCPNGFTVTSRNVDNLIQSIECTKKLRFGVQFHPEHSEKGHYILDNFVSFCRKSCSVMRNDFQASLK